MARITPEQHKQINILYREIGVYSQVAKIVGVSPSTVKNHIDPDFEVEDETKEYTFDPSRLPPQAYQLDLKGKPLGYYCYILDGKNDAYDEISELNAFRKEN